MPLAWALEAPTESFFEGSCSSSDLLGSAVFATLWNLERSGSQESPRGTWGASFKRSVPSVSTGESLFAAV